MITRYRLDRLLFQAKSAWSSDRLFISVSKYPTSLEIEVNSYRLKGGGHYVSR
jgi:hypothetical protein